MTFKILGTVNFRSCVFGPITYVLKVVFHAFLLLLISKYFILICAKWDLLVQLLSASLLLTVVGDNSLVYERRFTRAVVVLLGCNCI